MTDLEEPFIKKKQKDDDDENPHNELKPLGEDSEIVIVPLENVPNTKDGSLPQQQQGQGGLDQKKLGLEKVLVLGLWIWPLLWLVVDDEPESGFWAEVILLTLLKINQWVQKDYKPILAFNLIPFLIFLSLVLTSGVGDFGLPEALPFWTLLLIIIVTSHGSSPTTFRPVIGFTSKFKSPQQTTLRWGQWVWPNVLLLVVIVANGPSNYRFSYDVLVIWYGLLSIGNGAGLFLLWCRKQDPSQNKHHKQLFVSEVIPTILFALLPDDGDLFVPLLGLLIGIPVGIVLIFPRAAHERYKRIEIFVNGRFSSFQRCLTGTSFREMEEEYSIDVKEKEEEEERQLQLQQDRLAYLEDLSLSTDTTTRTTWSRLGLIAGVLLLFVLGFNIFSPALNIPQSNSSEKYASGWNRHYKSQPPN